MQYAYPLAFGVTSMGPFPVFNGGDDLSFAYSSLFNPAAVDPTGTSSLYYIFNDGLIKSMIDPGSTGGRFDYLAWQPKVQALSAQWDAKDPNIDAFQKKGGKLLLIQGTTDMLVSPQVTTDYFNSLKGRYADSLKTFARYFMVPGFGHGTGPFLSKWDSLSTLDAWASSGTEPTNQVTTDGSAATLGRTRPLCEYPLFPKYKGTGDVNSSASFSCSAI
jgi:feruloyl esterase